MAENCSNIFDTSAIHGGRAVGATTAGMQEVEGFRTNIGHIRVDSREGIGRVESGTETEKMPGADFPDRVDES
ncbi:MAG: hypothetical protein IIA77_04180 [Proteobacteria bacterium]|nr:hypothetical protein [Pseudomonadota bacterium]